MLRWFDHVLVQCIYNYRFITDRSRILYGSTHNYVRTTSVPLQPPFPCTVEICTSLQVDYKTFFCFQPFLFVMCSGNELFFAMLYLLHFTEGPLGKFLNYCAYTLWW